MKADLEQAGEVDKLSDRERAFMLSLPQFALEPAMAEFLAGEVPSGYDDRDGISLTKKGLLTKRKGFNQFWFEITMKGLRVRSILDRKQS